jgi:hypothetical protein
MEIEDARLSWGLSIETPSLNAARGFEDLKTKVQEVVNGKWAGIWTWRLGNDQENALQVWIYEQVHKKPIHSKTEDQIKALWG